MTADNLPPALERVATRNGFQRQSTLSLTRLGTAALGRRQSVVITKQEVTSVIDVVKQQESYFVQRSHQEVCKGLEVDPNKGLNTDEATRRFGEYGPNSLDSGEKLPPWKLFLYAFLAQLSSLLVILLLTAAIVSGALSHVVECVAILILVLGMALLGAYQELQAGASLDALTSMSAPNATVLRDGQVTDVDSTKLVPGDVILLETGRTIPADCRLVETQGLICAEAVLTGESMGVEKDSEYIGKPMEKVEVPATISEGDETKTDAAAAQPPAASASEEKKEEGHTEDTNLIFMGCTVIDGRAKAVVIRTGMKTRMGGVADLMNKADKAESPLQVKLDRLGKQLAGASLFVSIIVFIIGVARGWNKPLPGTTKPNNGALFIENLLIAVGLTVAAVPEALPTMVTITLSMGMYRMSQRKALMCTLHGTVTLAATSVICSDKTGTLTAGAMTAVRAWVDGLSWRITGIGFNPVGLYVPDGTNMDDPNAMAAAGEREKGKIFILPAVLATLNSNVTVQYSETGEMEIRGNMSEKPLVVATMKTGMKQAEIAATYPQIASNPFESRRKMMSTVVNIDGKANTDPTAPLVPRSIGYCPTLARGKALVTVKGAPNFVLDKCSRIMRKDGNVEPLTADERAKILAQIDAFSAEALRVLAIAAKPFDAIPNDTSPEAVEHDLILIGLFASIDPERPEVKGAIATAYKAGIRVVAISGDYTKTLYAIAKNIGLLPQDAPEEKVMDCEKIRPDGERSIVIENELNDKVNKPTPERRKVLEQELETIHERLDKITAYVDAFGRAKPQDKITILKSLQRQGHIASMTGDGVNDAPALAQANIGVAMGITGTDAAKAASSMILVDDSFGTIVNGVEEGRGIFRNISIFIFMLLSENTAEVLFVLISVGAGQQSPLDALQLLLLNLFTDGAPAVALAVETSGMEFLMLEAPRDVDESIISPIMAFGILVHVPILTFMCLLNYTAALVRYTGNWYGTGATKHDQHAANTVAFLYITVAELLRAYTSRSLRESLWTIGVFSNPWMQKSVGISLFFAVSLTIIPKVQDVFEFVPLQGIDWLWIVLTGLVPCIGDELLKWAYRKTGFGIRTQKPRKKTALQRKLEAEQAEQDPAPVKIDVKPLPTAQPAVDALVAQPAVAAQPVVVAQPAAAAEPAVAQPAAAAEAQPVAVAP